MTWTFQFSNSYCFGFRAFQSLRGPHVFCSPFIHHLWFAFYFFVYTTLIPFKSLKNKFPGKTKKFKKTIKSLNKFWKQSIFTTLFWLSFNYHNLPEGWDTFQMIQNIPHNAKTFWKKELSGQSENLPDILESFHTIWKLSRLSGIFPVNLKSLQTTCNLSR